MAYAQYTLSQLVTEISTYLGDPGNVYWSMDEIHFAINEGLRQWGLATAYWRDRGLFNISSTAAWYSLSEQIPSLRPKTVTVDHIVREIQYHLSEASNGVSGVGMTAQFTISEIIAAVNRARNQVAIDARMPISLDSKLPVQSPPYGRQTLADDIIFLHRASWTDSNNKTTALNRSDLYAQDSYNWQWNTKPGNPISYSVSDNPPLTIQLYAPPVASGLLNILSVKSLDLSAPDNTTTLGLADEITPAVKYLALADLVTTDGVTANPLLAQYCNQRYQQIISLARQQRSVIHAMLNGVNIPITPLSTIDYILPHCETQRRTPQFCGVLYDFIAFCPVSNTTRAASLDVVQSAPVPNDDLDYIQLGVEEINAISDYCQHYLSIKLGGEEFTSTFQSFDKFQRLAMQRSGILQIDTRYLSALFDQSGKEQAWQPFAETV